ncbi:hypothetical protein ACU5EH_02580 [Aliivibrio salmonicida]|uniref:hypothetical protein n=1 Tax=Aliivibrio salmonicida TaxID=40269 RepID=UPI00406C1664
MKNNLFGLLILLTSMSALGHSGGTDANGCHAGSEPYHCHNSKNNEAGSSLEFSAWDLNLGYQKQISETDFIPYAGLSLGQADINDGSAKLGLDLGLKFYNGFYLGYVTSSESVQVGYKFIHISAKSDMVGIGFRIPFYSKKQIDHSGFYFSASGQLSEPEE